MQVHASQCRKKPSLPHAALQQPLPGPPRMTAHYDNNRQSQMACTCCIAALACGSNSYTSTGEDQNTRDCHALAGDCCSKLHPCPWQCAKSFLEQGESHWRGVEGRPAAQRFGVMRGSEAFQKRPWQMPEHVCLDKKQPQTAPRIKEASASCNCSDSDQNQAFVALSEKDKRHGVKVGTSQVQQLSAMADMKTNHRDPMIQGGHAQLLADIDSFINSLQRPTEALRSALQPMHAATAGVPEEDALPGPIKRPRAMLDKSGTDGGNPIAGFVSRFRSASERAHWDPKAKLDSAHLLHTAGQQDIEGAADDSHSNSKLSSPAAKKGIRLYQQQEENTAVRRDGKRSTEGVSTASQSGVLSHQGRTFAETDQAVHKLHNLEDTAQASLDELESLLREQQLKVRPSRTHYDTEQDLLSNLGCNLGPA